MGKFRKRPVVIDAVQWDGYNLTEIQQFVGKWLGGDFYASSNNEPPTASLTILTLEGEMIASIGDWIIKGVNGEFYPCKPDIFEKTYEIVDD